jgi:hypothetical protein
MGDYMVYSKEMMRDVLSRKGPIPDDEAFWLSKYEDMPVIFSYVKKYKLPSNFKFMHLKGKLSISKKGEWTTVAHEAAKFNHLPHGFSDWGFLNSVDQTVLEIFAQHNKQSGTGFLRFVTEKLALLKCRSDMTFAEFCMVNRIPIPIPAHSMLWEHPTKSGMPLAHLAAHNKNLPSNFKRWGIEHHGQTVAHILALKGGTPLDFNRLFLMNFDEWFLKNDEGETVIQTLLNKKWIPDSFLNDWDAGSGNDTVIGLLAKKCPSLLNKLDYSSITESKLEAALAIKHSHPDLYNKIAISHYINSDSVADAVVDAPLL